MKLYIIADTDEGRVGVRVEVSSYGEASELWTLFREEYNPGASNLVGRCGDVVDDFGELVAHVSYNSKVWSPDQKILLYDPYIEEETDVQF